MFSAQLSAIAAWQPPPLHPAGQEGDCTSLRVVVEGAQPSCICQASFDRLGAAHVQVSAHVMREGEVLVLLRRVSRGAEPLQLPEGHVRVLLTSWA